MEHSESAKENTVSKQVLDKILSHQLHTRPRVYFTLQTIAFVVVAFLVLGMSVSIGSFILFSIRMSSEVSLLRFGPPGYVIFLHLFPWGLLALDIAGIFVLEWMLRKFRFGYRTPLLYLFFALIVIVLSGMAAVDRLHVSDRFLQGARDHHVPVMGAWYDAGRLPPPPGSGACDCVITSTNGSVITAEEHTPDGTVRPVNLTLPPNIATSSMHAGDHFFIVGRYINNELQVVGVEVRGGGPIK